jgi:hypothetical protein
MAQVAEESVSATLERLVEDSTAHYYNPYQLFDWPDRLEEQQWWMSRDLMSVAGTPWEERLDEAQLMRLSKYEVTNFFSLNIHGIRELLIEVTRRIHTPGFDEPSEFFHRFLGEENGHMWFFAQFCLRYGGKIYADKALRMGDDSSDAEVASFLVFSRILIFEELVDYFNIRMSKDETLHPLIRKINHAHHADEWRHIVMGRKLVDQLFAPLGARNDQELLGFLDQYLRRYMVASIQSLYNPVVFRDAGVPDAYKLRMELFDHPARGPYHQTFLKRITAFLRSHGILQEAPF